MNAGSRPGSLCRPDCWLDSPPMRRIVATLVLLSLANFTLASAEPACVVTSPTPAAESAGHAHHQPAPPASEHDGVRHDEGSDAGSPHCLMMSQCVSSVALLVEVRPAIDTALVANVPARSIHLPRSGGTAPDLPPPRA